MAPVRRGGLHERHYRILRCVRQTTTVAFAQPAGEMPEYEGEVNGVSNGAVTPLERQNSGLQFKAPIMGFGSPKAVVKVKGKRSPVRFLSSQPFYFVLRANQATNPADLWQLNPMEQKGGSRQMTMVSIGLGGSRDTRNETAIQLRFQKYGKIGFKVTPATPLPPGEYAISMSGLGGSVSLFGVD